MARWSMPLFRLEKQLLDLVDRTSYLAWRHPGNSAIQGLSVVRVPFVAALRTRVEDRAALIC